MDFKPLPHIKNVGNITITPVVSTLSTRPITPPLAKRIKTEVDLSFLCIGCGHSYSTPTALYTHLQCCIKLQEKEEETERFYGSELMVPICEIQGDCSPVVDEEEDNVSLGFHSLRDVKSECESEDSSCFNTIEIMKKTTKRGRRKLCEINNTMFSSEPNCFQCTQCEDSFGSAGDLARHVRAHFNDRPYMCSICEKTFTHIGSLNTHLRIHSGEKPYKCKICPKAFTQSSSLMVHEKSHAVRKAHQCPICDKGFTSYSSFCLHVKQHSENSVYTCGICDNVFKFESLLEEHMKTHNSQNLYQCAICLDTYKTANELAQHMKEHLGDKPFQCSICEKSFTQAGSLNIHMRIHTGEKPHQCIVCDKQFTQSTSMNLHMKIHHGALECKLCGDIQGDMEDLNAHILQKHMQTNAGIACLICKELFRSTSDLAIHVTNNHSEILQKFKEMRRIMA